MGIVYYFGVFIVSALLLSKAQYQSAKVKRNLFIVLGLLCCSIFAGIRFKVGTDYGTYCLIYNRPEYFRNIEKGFIAIVKMAKLLGNYKWMFFLSALVTSIFAWLSIIRKDINYFVAFLIFFICVYAISFNVVRQGIAVSIMMFAIVQLENSKYKYFILLTILASLFHSTAVIAGIAYFFLKIIQNFKKGYIVLAILSIGFVFLFQKYYKYIIRFLDKWKIFERIIKYMAYLDTTNTSNKIFIIKLFIFLLCALFAKKIITHNEGNRLYFGLFTLEVAVEKLGSISPYFKRMEMYFVFGEIVIVSQLFCVGKNRLTKFWINFLIICFYLLYFSIYALSGYSNLLPYRIN